MQAHRFISITLGAAALSLALTAHASGFFASVPQVIQDADSGFTFALGTLHQHYVETQSTGTLDQEHGNLPVYTFALESQGDYFGSGLWMQYADGSDHYDGALQYYNPTTHTITLTPYQTTTQNKLFDLRYDLDVGFSPIHGLAVIPLGFVGLHLWHRAIQGTGAVTENYLDGYYGVGLRLQYALSEQFVLGVTGRYGTTFVADMTNGSMTFHLGTAPWYSAGARLTWIPLSWLKVYVGDTFTGFSYGASAVQVIPGGGGLTEQEPHSRTLQNVAEVGIRIF